MSIDERSRHQMYERLRVVLGDDEATTLMEHLPPTGWSDVARTTDIDAVRSDIDAVRSDIDVVRNEMDSFRAATTTEFTAVRSEMATEFAAVRREMAYGFETLRQQIELSTATLRAEFQRELRIQGFAVLAGVALMLTIVTSIQQIVAG